LVGGRHHHRNPGHPPFVAGVVDQTIIAHLHRFDEVDRLGIGHTIPHRLAVAHQIGVGIDIGFTFEQPICHVSFSFL
jgi:hypothetical protein